MRDEANWNWQASLVRRQRWMRFGAWLLAAVAFGYVYHGASQLTVVMAQTDDDELEAPDEAAPAPPAAAPETSKDSNDKSDNTRSMFEIVMSAGWFWVLVFALLSLTAVFFIIEHSITIRKSALLPEHVLIELEQMIARGEIPQAAEYCHLPENESLASEVVLAGLERFQGSEFGFAEYKTAVEEAGEDYLGRLYRKTEVLGIIGSVAPMLGLMGTVVGMISAFNTIAQQEGSAKPAELAGGIGTALLTTLFGLSIAIPSMISYSFFRNKIDSIVSEAGKRVERIMMPLGRKR